MWRMLQQETPDDYVIATGQTFSVREFLDAVGDVLDFDWTPHVEIDPKYYRPAEVDLLLGDASKAQQQLGWSPRTTFRDLVRMMTEADLALAKAEAGGAEVQRELKLSLGLT
jgi:GDPmannose 4,6-dehydratase